MSDVKFISVIIVLILLAFYGLPEEINFFGKWCIKNCEKEGSIQPTAPRINVNPQEITTSRQLVSIENFEPRQKIYKIGENATVDFVINDERNVNYNFTVNWLLNDTRFYGWSANGSQTESYHSWYPISQKGRWEVQVVLTWEYLNQAYSKDEVREFKAV